MPTPSIPSPHSTPALMFSRYVAVDNSGLAMRLMQLVTSRSIRCVFPYLLSTLRRPSHTVAQWQVLVSRESVRTGSRRETQHSHLLVRLLRRPFHADVPVAVSGLVRTLSRKPVPNTSVALRESLSKDVVYLYLCVCIGVPTLDSSCSWTLM